MSEHAEKRRGKRVKQVRTAKSHQSIEALFDKFYSAKVAEGRAMRTLDQYKQNFASFISYLDEKGITRDVSEINVDLIRSYILYMKDEMVRFKNNRFKSEEEKTTGLSASTINTRLKTLRVLFKFLEDEDQVEFNPMKMVKDVSEPQEHIDVLTIVE